MIPYFQWTHFYIGPVPIHIWGLMVSLGIVFGLFVSIQFAKSREVPTQHIIDISFWLILFALIGARLVFILSDISFFVQNPWSVFKIWEGGMSISGGFLGALMASWTLLRKKKYPLLKYIDTLLFGLPAGLWIGRLGCFFIFDHPGVATSFFLGQKYIDGIIRHNHGLYLSINGLLLFLLYLYLWKRRPRQRYGFYAIVFLLWYGVTRFCLDFMRSWDLSITDVRYFDLTIAQYMSITMVAGGLYLWYSLYRKPTKK